MERNHFILNAKSILLILFLVSSGCATTKNQSNAFNPEDPYEKSNRKVLGRRAFVESSKYSRSSTVYY